MNILIVVLSVIIALLVIALIIALFIKQDYAVEREIIISKPKNEIFSYIKYLKNQDNYSKWASMDADMKKEFRGTDGTVGFVSAWESQKKDVGKGEQEILKITENEKIEFEIRFMKPFKSIAKAYLITEFLTEQHSRVIWGFKSKMHYPMNLMLLFLKMDKLIGKDFETGLFNLKVIMEKPD